MFTQYIKALAIFVVQFKLIFNVLTNSLHYQQNSLILWGWLNSTWGIYITAGII